MKRAQIIRAALRYTQGGGSIQKRSMTGSKVEFALNAESARG
jgi:hypothetical protein